MGLLIVGQTFLDLSQVLNELGRADEAPDMRHQNPVDVIRHLLVSLVLSANTKVNTISLSLGLITFNRSAIRLSHALQRQAATFDSSAWRAVDAPAVSYSGAAI
jgi:hypothetical protein